jgi:hypothetical protein
MITATIMNIRTITGTTLGMFIMNTTGMSSAGMRARHSASRSGRVPPPCGTRNACPGKQTGARDAHPPGWTFLVHVAAILLATAAPVNGQTSSETLRVENEYRECLYAKSRNGRYARGERESDFGLLGECRNQWVAYMDVCNKTGFDNPTCVMKSRLVIHAILNLTGK